MDAGHAWEREKFETDVRAKNIISCMENKFLCVYMFSVEKKALNWTCFEGPELWLSCAVTGSVVKPLWRSEHRSCQTTCTKFHFKQSTLWKYYVKLCSWHPFVSPVNNACSLTHHQHHFPVKSERDQWMPIAQCSSRVQCCSLKWWQTILICKNLST